MGGFFNSDGGKTKALLKIEHDETIAIANDRVITVDAEHHLKTTGKHIELRESDASLEIKGDFAQKVENNLGIKVSNHIVLESDQQITLKVGGSFVVIHSGGVHIQGPVVTINSGGTPADVVTPTSPKVLDTAAAEGKAFVFHCPLAEKAKADSSGISSGGDDYESITAFDYGNEEGLGGSDLGDSLGGFGEGVLGGLGSMINNATNLLNSVQSIRENPLSALNALDGVANAIGMGGVSQVTGRVADIANQGMAIANTIEQAKNNPATLVNSLGLPNIVSEALGGEDVELSGQGQAPNFTPKRS